METLILQTDNDEATKEILDFIKKMKSVKFVSVEKSEEKLNDHDWASPGRYASDSEIESLSIAMDSETEYKKADDVFKDIINSIK